jgi:hypothetical protein
MANTVDYSAYTQDALERGKKLTDTPATPYPSYVPSQTYAPTQVKYADYTPTQNLQQIAAPTYQQTAPAAPNYQGVNTNVDYKNWAYQQSGEQAPQWQNINFSTYQGADPTQTNLPQWQNWNFQNYGGSAPAYKGLLGGDYEALQKALTTPGEIAAQTAYNQGTNNLVNTMGGQGLYGSSIMANQQRNALDTVYQNALSANAANAAAQRYQLQQADLANMNEQQMQAYLARLSEATTGQQLGAAQNIAQNQFGTDILGEQMKGYLGRMGENTAIQGLLSNQNIAQNQNLTDVYKARLGEWQTGQGLNAAQNIAYNQSLGDNANRALTQSRDANAFAQTGYGQQLSREQDMNQFAANLFPSILQQNKNIWETANTENQNRRAYDTDLAAWNQGQADRLTNWQNQQLREPFDYNIAKAAFDTTNQQNALTGLLNYGQLGNAAQANANNYNLAQQAQQAAIDAANQQGLWNFAGTAAGGLLSGNNLNTLINLAGQGVQWAIDELNGMTPEQQVIYDDAQYAP